MPFLFLIGIAKRDGPFWQFYVKGSGLLIVLNKYRTLSTKRNSKKNLKKSEKQVKIDNNLKSKESRKDKKCI